MVSQCADKFGVENYNDYSNLDLAAKARDIDERVRIFRSKSEPYFFNEQERIYQRHN